ncbi:MAG: hypothetical protein JW969_05695 [Spirochaetales bacterium]|nr:hypothetical protein [Spirochaetales bacterium]
MSSINNLINRFFLKGYEQADTDVQNQARTIVYFSCVISVLILLALLGYLVIAPSIETVGILTAGLAIYLVTLLFIKYRHLVLGSNILIFIMLINLSLVGFMKIGTIRLLDFYLGAMMLILMQISTVLLHTRIYQYWAVTIASPVVIVFQFFINVAPSVEKTQSAEIYASLFTVLIIFIMIAAMTYFYQMSQKRMILSIQTDLDINRQRLKQTESILEESQKNMNIGEELITTTDKAIRFLADVKQRVQEIENGAEVLSRNVSGYTGSNSEILESTAKMSQTVIDQNTNINESVAAISEMTSSIKNIAGISEAKQAIMEKLLHTTREANELVSRAHEAIGKVNMSANKIMDINKVIVKISAKTNLLAMNAAIEAAHAGDYGRGFSVVATEIRNLSEDTGKNTKIISNTIKTNNADIEVASQLYDATGQTFEQINKEVNEVSFALNEIISGMKELNIGADEIHTAIQGLNAMSETTRASSDLVSEKIGTSNSSLMELSNLAQALQKNTDAMGQEIDQILAELNQLKANGIINIQQIKTLSGKISQLKQL